MAAETGLLIDGRFYDLPTRDSFDFDEWQIMYDYSRLGLYDFAPLPDDADDETVRERDQQFRNPAVLRAFLHIAYQRENPDVPADKVKKLIGKVNPFESMEHLADEEEQPPLAQTSDQPGSSLSGSLENENSPRPLTVTPANGSTTSSDEPDGPVGSTTPLRQDTSSISLHEISAA